MRNHDISGTAKIDFNAAALKWDEKPRRVKLKGEIPDAITAAIQLSTEWDALDLGCGTGLVMLQPAPNLQSMTGTDSSSGMIDRLGTKIQDCGFSNVRAVRPGKWLPASREHLTL